MSGPQARIESQGQPLLLDRLAVFPLRDQVLRQRVIQLTVRGVCPQDQLFGLGKAARVASELPADCQEAQSLEAVWIDGKSAASRALRGIVFLFLDAELGQEA